jgi:predicted RNA-binding Zn ribbon-like protein
MSDVFEGTADEQILLDLLNSTPVVDGVTQDELGTTSQAQRWLRAHGGTATRAELTRVRALRPVLQAVVRGDRSAGELAPFLARVSYRPSMSSIGINWELDAAPDRALAARAVLAWDALRVSAPGRLRACANSDCNLYLLDRSKANTGRWCSMAVCGNRMKARRHYERARRTGE